MIIYLYLNKFYIYSNWWWWHHTVILILLLLLRNDLILVVLLILVILHALILVVRCWRLVHPSRYSWSLVISSRWFHDIWFFVVWVVCIHVYSSYYKVGNRKLLWCPIWRELKLGSLYRRWIN